MKKEKIGIITFHGVDNYGAFLQVYALQKWIERECSMVVEVIDYRPKYLSEPYQISFRGRVDKNAPVDKKIKSFLIFLYELPYKLIKKFRFKISRKKLNLSKSKYKNENFILDSTYKMLILGSDQIWNPEITNGLDLVYFGQNAQNECVRISYAASIGVLSYPQELKEKLTRYLNNIDCVGVREKTAANVLSAICQKDYIVNIDPTLLVDAEVWNKVVKSVPESNYILVYQLRSGTNLFEDARMISERTGKRILYFGDPELATILEKKNMKSVAFSGPIEFISYIKGAEIVLTDSFHATCFSLIFERPFFTYLHKSRSERMIDLAEEGGFLQRLINAGERLDWEWDFTNDKFGFKEIKENLSYLRRSSEDYLRTCLQKII